MARDFPVIAIIAAYNEEDIIGQVVAHLVDQGVGVYLLDHGSTDGTVAAVEPYRGRGLLGIEGFPAAGAEPVEGARRFSLEAIVRRKEALAAELDADWIINHDADEFRESPWAHLGLAAAIRRVDALGYSAIDFEVFNFWPTHDRFRPGDDVRAAFGHYAPGPAWDKVQVRCWKKTGAPVDLASSAGHEAVFPGRRVFPLRFILCHYPIRGQAHGERKVFRERRPAFSEAERGRGWHVQYDLVREGESFLRDPATLTPFDLEAARLQVVLRHRGVEELEARLEETRARLEERARVRAEEAGSLRAELGKATRRIDELLASRSWRWTAPLRAAQRRLTGR